MMPGFTRLENDTHLKTIFSLPVSLQATYLYLVYQRHLKPPGVTWGSISIALGLSRATVYRVLSNLQSRGLVSQNRDKWCLISETVESASNLKSETKVSQKRDESVSVVRRMKRNEAVQHDQNSLPKEVKEVKEKSFLEKDSNTESFSSSGAVQISDQKPPSKRKPRAEKSKQPRPRNEMMDAVMVAWVGSVEGATGQAWGRCLGPAAELVEAGYKPEEVALIRQFLLNDGWKPEMITPQSLEREAPRWRNAGANQKRSGYNYPELSQESYL